MKGVLKTVSERQQPTALTPAESASELAALYAELAPRVYTFALRQLANQQDAEDIVSEVFARLLKQRRRGSSAEIRGWVFRTARNLTVDYWRTRSRRRTVQLNEDQLSRDPLNIDGLLLIQLLATLPFETREMILLRLVVGLTAQEIAAMTHKNQGAIKMQIHRGILKLRKLWNEANP